MKKIFRGLIGSGRSVLNYVTKFTGMNRHTRRRELAFAHRHLNRCTTRGWWYRARRYSNWLKAQRAASY